MLLLQAAIQAVDEVDVLKDDLDFVALGKKFREQSEQQSEPFLQNAGPSQLATKLSALPVSSPRSSEVLEDAAYWTAVQSALSSDINPAGLESLDRTSAIITELGISATFSRSVQEN